MISVFLLLYEEGLAMNGKIPSSTIVQRTIKEKSQVFGSYLSAMITPNISVFIAWGFINVLFSEDGFLPNEDLAELSNHMIYYLLPLLISFTGGKIVYGYRGGVVGATATIGLIIGMDIPMILGSMLMGPLGGYVIKQFDKTLERKTRQGFEMFVNNFSAGFTAFILTLLAFLIVGPVFESLTKAMSTGVNVIINLGLLPLTSIFIEPLKLLFLNNIINHGILTPLGVTEVAATGKSILFLLETNPGPGLGLLLSLCIFGKGITKQSTSAATAIHFFGGIHEIYFPYIIMKPLLLIAVIAGGMSGILTFSLLNAGLVAMPSPGGIFSIIILTLKGDYIAVLAGVIIAAVVSFLVSSFILTISVKEEYVDENNEQELNMEEHTISSILNSEKDIADRVNEGKQSIGEQRVFTKAYQNEEQLNKPTQEVNKVIFSCDAGMGSSAMGASILRDKFKQAGIKIDVTNTSINNLPDDADIIITHQSLTERAKAKLPCAEHISISNFLSSPKYDELVKRLKT